MISISGKKWDERKIDQKNIDKIKQDHDFSEILSKLIITRNFDDDEIYTISNQINISNVFLNNDDYKKSIEILVDTINKK